MQLALCVAAAQRGTGCGTYLFGSRFARGHRRRAAVYRGAIGRDRGEFGFDRAVGHNHMRRDPPRARRQCERRAQDEVQKLTDRTVNEIDRLVHAKEAEIMAV